MVQKLWVKRKCKYLSKVGQFWVQINTLQTALGDTDEKVREIAETALTRLEAY